jgi:hypothetical protein
MPLTLVWKPYTMMPMLRIYRIVEIHGRITTYSLSLEALATPGSTGACYSPGVTMAFRRAELNNRLLNGAASEMKLKYYGSYCTDGIPIIRIAGKGFQDSSSKHPRPVFLIIIQIYEIT